MRLCSRNPSDGDADIRNNVVYTHLILDSAQKRKTNNSKSVNISMVDLGLGCRSVDIFESKNYENIMQITRKFVREVSTRVRIIFSSGTMRITICWQTHTQHTTPDNGCTTIKWNILKLDDSPLNLRSPLNSQENYSESNSHCGTTKWPFFWSWENYGCCDERRQWHSYMSRVWRGFR